MGYFFHKESTKKASSKQNEDYRTHLDLGQLLICAAASFLLLCYICLLLRIAHTPVYMRYSFYLLKLFPCETWLQGWIHFWRCSHKSQLAYGGWHRERRKRIKDGDSRDTKENDFIFFQITSRNLDYYSQQSMTLGWMPKLQTYFFLTISVCVSHCIEQPSCK